MLGDELELIEGDYVFMTPGQSSPDGWYSGTSWLTGNTGMFPAVFTQRTSETWIWTLHRSVDIGLFPRLPGFGVLALVEGLNSVFFFLKTDPKLAIQVLEHTDGGKESKKLTKNNGQFVSIAFPVPSFGTLFPIQVLTLLYIEVVFQIGLFLFNLPGA